MPLTQEQIGDCTRLTPVHVIAFYSACVARSRLKQKVPPYAFPAGRRSKTQATSVRAISIWPPGEFIGVGPWLSLDRPVELMIEEYWGMRGSIDTDARSSAETDAQPRHFASVSPILQQYPDPQ